MSLKRLNDNDIAGVKFPDIAAAFMGGAPFQDDSDFDAVMGMVRGIRHIPGIGSGKRKIKRQFSRFGFYDIHSAVSFRHIRFLHFWYNAAGKKNFNPGIQSFGLFYKIFGISEKFFRKNIL